MNGKKIVDRKKIKQLHQEIVNSIEMILDKDSLNEDVLLQNSADQIGITKELLIEILNEKKSS